MKHLVFALALLSCSCSVQKPSNTSPPVAYQNRAPMNYSILGKINLDANPLIWADINSLDPLYVCELFRESKGALLRVKSIIENSRRLNQIEREMFDSEKYRILETQISNATEDQKMHALYLKRDAEEYVKFRVSAAIEDAFKNGLRDVDLAGFSYVIVADKYSYAYPVCPEAFRIENRLIYYIDNEQKI